MNARRRRTMLLFALLTSLSFGGAPATSQQPADDWALKIVDRRVDEASGRPVVTIWNGSDQEVVAYGIAGSLRGPGGRGSTTIGGRSFFPGEGRGIGPGESREVEAGGWPAEDPGPGWTHSVEIAYEILADNTAHGDERYIEREFSYRLTSWAELDAALVCLRRRAEGIALETEFRDLLREVRTCAESVLAELKGVLEDGHSRETVGSLRLDSPQVSSLTEQTLERFEAGDSVEFLLSSLEQVLEEQASRYEKGLRPSDLERLGH